jgi:hypothetical protein
MAIRQGGFPGLFLDATALDFIVGRMDGVASMTGAGRAIANGAAHMNGAASMAAIGSLVTRGAGRMDGQASMSGDSQAVTHGAPHITGVASMTGVGHIVVSTVGRMDGQGGMVAPHPIGATVGAMHGVGEMTAISHAPPPQTYPMSLQDGIIGTQPRPAPRLTYHLGLLQRTFHTLVLKNVLRINVILPEHAINLTTGFKWKWVPRLQETIRIHLDAPTHTSYHYNFIDDVRVRPTLSPGYQAIFELMERINLSQTVSEKFIWGRLLKETLKVSSVVGASGRYQKSLAQLFKLAEGFKVGRSITLNQNINVHPSLAAASFVTLLQKMLVSSAASPVLHYHLKLIAEIVIQDIIGHYHFADMLLAELFTIQPTLARQYIAGSHMAELINLSSVLRSKLVLQITGNIQLSPSQLVHMIYAGDPLLDGVVIDALFVSPSGTTTTWAVNTRTNAVTEYMNYDFRSFAQMGNRYIAAGAEGLYELEGDTDDGASIIAEMMSGYLQLNDKKLFGIKGAYIAIRGGGRFYLKLISGDGREYVYELRAQPNLMTTKVRVGKGISTSYVAFDLITEGQDFDLDSIEFIPMTRGRRV